jgi:hypothetical protein
MACYLVFDNAHGQSNLHALGRTKKAAIRAAQKLGPFNPKSDDVSIEPATRGACDEARRNISRGMGPGPKVKFSDGMWRLKRKTSR